MLERGLQFTERRSHTAQRRLITPFFARFRLSEEPDEAGTKSVDFAKDQ
jgi:hypothetical protein